MKKFLEDFSEFTVTWLLVVYTKLYLPYVHMAHLSLPAVIVFSNRTFDVKNRNQINEMFTLINTPPTETTKF